MNKKILISLFLGTMISIFGLYLAFRNVPFIELYHYLGSINYIWVLPAMLVILLSFVLRAVRWRIILTSSHPVSFADAFHPLMIGFMTNCILPGRVGEFARPVIIQQQSRIPFSTGIATVAAERIFDMLILLGLFAWLLADMDLDAAAAINFGEMRLDKSMLDALARGISRLAGVLIAGIIIISIPYVRLKMNAVIMALPSIFFFLGQSRKNYIRDRICPVLVKLMENIATGFSLVRYPVKLLSCTVLTAVIWIMQAFSYYIVARGCPGISLSFIDIFIVMIIICFFIALPSVPGFWGLWEAGGVFALALFGINAKDAAGFTLVNHAVQVFPVIIAGLISAVLISVDIRQFSSVKTAEHES
jgi:glycosyltransferase 2 family protein